MKRIQFVSPADQNNQLAAIYCMTRDINCTNWNKEVFFIDKIGKIVAHFKNNIPFEIKVLSSKNNMYRIKYGEFLYLIVRVLSDFSYVRKASYQDIGIYKVNDDYIPVKKNGLWGFIDKKSAKEIIIPQYENCYDFNCGIALVKKDGKWGAINQFNEIIIPFEYEIPEHSRFGGSQIPVGKNNKFGFIDINNNIVIPLKYENVLYRSKYGKLYPVKLNNKWGFIDQFENVIIPFEFDNVECNTDGYSVYKITQEINGKKLYGLVDARTNKILISCNYISLCPNPAAIRVQKQNNKYVLLNWNGEEVSEEYDYVEENSSEGLFIARKNSKEGYLNENGEIEIPFMYDRCENFYNGAAVVEIKNCLQIINPKNSIIFNAKGYSKIYNTGLKIYILENENETVFLGNLKESIIEKLPIENLKAESYSFIKNIDDRTKFLQKIGIDKMLQYGKVVDTYENYPENEMWAKSEYKIIDMSDLKLPKVILGRGGQVLETHSYAPYLYMKNQTTGVYHLEGIHPRCKTLYDAIKMRYNGLNISDFEIKDIK